MAGKTLWSQLNSLFPSILQEDASKAINGTSLLELVKPKLDRHFSDDTIRQYFSYMSQDPNTTLAKKSDGHGYYLRSAQEQLTNALESSPEVPAMALLGRDAQPEEKFRAVFMRYSGIASLQFPMLIEHTSAKKGEAGKNQWKFPDVVILGWGVGVGKLTEEGFKLDPILLKVKSSLGEPPFSLQCAELKVKLTMATHRENFFQCLSNSKWAHESVLAVAMNVNDEALKDELERLGASYDVSVISYGLSEEEIENLPTADKIREMPIGEFEQKIASKITISRITTGKKRTSLDWAAIKDMQTLSQDFKNLFEWIACCLDEKKAFSFADFLKISEIKKGS